MSKFWNKTTTSLEPYVPGEQPKDKKYIKLNTNENPYPPSPQALKAMQEAVNGDLRLYPDPTCSDLRETIAGYYGLTSDQVFVGNGSDEILALAFQGFFSPDKPIVFPDITYSFYPVYAKLYGLRYELVPLDDQFEVPIERLCQPNGGVILPNPNAPTAKYMPLGGIRAILERNTEHVVLIDEAYIDFGGETAAALINDYPNLLVVQTLSKSRSLAGLRVGMALGNRELIEGLDRVKNSFNSYPLDRVALAGAAAAIKDDSYFKETTQKVISTRDAVVLKLRKSGFHVAESKANFIFISHASKPAEEIFLALREKAILVRYFNKPRINNFLRVTIGTDAEMEEFVRAISEIVGEA
ncbi:histidinol-phosphate transaminase [Paenibacillus abyssi]|uniref:Histidinol-phosphate aminotransferase n=1 Tax=Paenibacillus abyssi TaxID=1340531 RepID=A0A917LDN7_9BACL|nr:histidinol-phosphate transaminase [Paenibacillus abyssi]GGG14958.1 histidinol-phosphate aminotransferase [Paenibacillus abyssi]